MPFQTSAPPPVPMTFPLIWVAYTGASGTGNNSMLAGSNGIGWSYTGGGAFVAARTYNPTTGVYGVQMAPAAGADLAVERRASNQSGAIGTSFLSILQGGTVSPLVPPGVAWTTRYRVPLVVNYAGGTDSRFGMGFWGNWGPLASRPRGNGIVMGGFEGAANFRIYAQDADLSGGGTITLNVDTGVPIAAGQVYNLEWRWGSDGSGVGFVRAFIDGTLVWNPTLPVAAALPIPPTTNDYKPGLWLMRGSNAADTVEVFVPDQPYPECWSEVTP